MLHSDFNSYLKGFFLIIFRYLGRQVMVSMLAVTIVLLLIFMSGRFVKYLAKAAAGGISPDILMGIMLYRLPGFLELILPLGFFIGILLAYGRMYLESEMTVLHACGFSQKQLLFTSLIYAFFVSLLVGMMSLFFSPWGFQNVDRLLAEQSKKTEFEMLLPGRFQEFDSVDSVVYTESISDDKKVMSNVFIAAKAKGDQLLNLIYAESGAQEIDPSGDRYLILNNGTRYLGQPGQLNYQSIQFKSYGMKIEEVDGEEVSIDHESMSSLALWEDGSLEARALLQWRISLPLILPVMTLLAVSISRVNPRQGRFAHLFPAMLVYIAYLGLLIVARKSLAKGELPEWLGLWSVHILFLILSSIMMNKERLMHAIKQRKKKVSVHAKN
jgi:lipopolysaccharide export system permease protein